MAHNDDISKLMSADELYWLGIHNFIQPLKFRPVNGLNLTYNNWKSDEPKYDSKRGVTINPKHEGEWASLQAETKLSFMCMFIIRAKDINECETNAHNCHLEATCTNTIKGFTCSCDRGYVGNGIVCSDINECFWGSHH